jgi:hypothetical protein
LSRSISALVHGDIQRSLQYHALGSLFLVGLMIVGIVTILPNQRRLKALTYLQQLESKTGFVAIFLIILVVYWLARLIILRSVFINLILG